MGIKNQYGKMFLGFLSLTILLAACSAEQQQPPQKKYSVQEAEQGNNLSSIKIGDDVSAPSIRTVQSGNIFQSSAYCQERR